MLGKFVLLTTISIGSSMGWWFGSGGGIMGSYLAGVLGASIGLFIGRRMQKSLDRDD